MTDLIKRPLVQKAIQLFVQEPNITAQEVAKRLEVSTALVYNWKQNPNFVDAIYDKYMVEFGSELPAVLQSMIREAKAGNVQAGRLVLEHSGKLVKNVNITVDSPYEKFLKADKAEIEFEDAEIEEIVESVPDIKVDLPKRKKEDQSERAVEEKKNLKKAIKKGEANKKRTEWRKWKKRAKAVGLEPLPARRPTPAQKEAWINEIKEKENKQR
tara:strand:+ start:215 stop:853 length:639 start_codon:yes stop_codon:yes gene_type:complete